jgi:hypothetical protein
MPSWIEAAKGFRGLYPPPACRIFIQSAASGAWNLGRLRSDFSLLHWGDQNLEERDERNLLCHLWTEKEEGNHDPAPAQRTRPILLLVALRGAMGEIESARGMRVNGCQFGTFFPCNDPGFFLYLEPEKKVLCPASEVKRPLGIASKRNGFRAAVSLPTSSGTPEVVTSHSTLLYLAVRPCTHGRVEILSEWRRLKRRHFLCDPHSGNGMLYLEA